MRLSFRRMTLLNNVITLYSEEVRLKLTELQKRTSNKQIQTKRKFDKVNVAEFRKRITVRTVTLGGFNFKLIFNNRKLKIFANSLF